MWHFIFTQLEMGRQKLHISYCSKSLLLPNFPSPPTRSYLLVLISFLKSNFQCKFYVIRPKQLPASCKFLRKSCVYKWRVLFYVMYITYLKFLTKWRIFLRIYFSCSLERKQNIQWKSLLELKQISSKDTISNSNLFHLYRN